MRFVTALLICGCVTTAATTAAPVTQARVATVRERIADIPQAKGDIRDLYKKVAPATVLVRSKHGFGTGVIIDPRGFVLTNHHVIAEAENVDFKRRVKIEMGALSAQGYMEKRPEQYVAWVLKSDPGVDLAVLKIEKAPEGLPSVEISPTDPTPGEPVAALGHGAVGLLWAIRDGEVASIGKLATHMAQLAALVGPEVEQERAQVASEMPALVIQSSCQISPGDSGGPLVNRAGQLVGVNAFLQSDRTAPVTTNFHVHVSEVRAFLKEVPSEAAAKLPDPKDLSKGYAEKIDADRDGIVETTAYPSVVLSDLGEGISIAVGTDGDHVMVWSDNRLVIEDRYGSGRGTAWAMTSPPRKESDNALLFDRSKLPPKAAARFEAVQRAVLTPYGLPVNEAWDVAPDPFAAAKWKLLDVDGDGKHDTAWSGASVLLDPKQKISEPITKAPIAFVRKSARAWCVLDGQTTLASEDMSSGAVTIGDATGQGMLAYALEGLDAAEKKRATTAMRRLWPRMVLHGSPWPDAVADVGSDVMAEESGLKGLEYAMVSVVGTDASSMLFELDRDAVSPSPGEMEKRARKGQGIDMAWVRRSQTEWFLYDTDHDGTFDVMLFLPPTGDVEGFRMVGGKVVRAKELDGGRTVRVKLFKDEKQRQAFGALAKVFFNPEVVEQ